MPQLDFFIFFDLSFTSFIFFFCFHSFFILFFIPLYLKQKFFFYFFMFYFRLRYIKLFFNPKRSRGALSFVKNEYNLYV